VTLKSRALQWLETPRWQRETYGILQISKYR
jgi:hypothetical protein